MLNLPSDAFADSGPPDRDLAADWLESNAFLSVDGQAFCTNIVDTLELSADADRGIAGAAEDVASSAMNRVAERQRALSEAYPFAFDDDGDTVDFRAAKAPNVGQTAYLLCLVLSNLRAVSPLLVDPAVHPDAAEERDMRRSFQYFSTAALAAEVGGPAWSFGFPRPDGSGFIEKLTEIWAVIGDGVVEPDPSAPRQPKDDGVDIFACRDKSDQLPGFLFAAAQVATGKDWKDKSIRYHIRNVFPNRWFARSPATEIVPYHIVPFALPDDTFRDNVRVLGNILHRIRVPLRVREADNLFTNGVAIEAFDRLAEGANEMQRYRDRVRQLDEPGFPA